MTSIEIVVPKIGRWMSANDRPNRWAKAAETKTWRAAGHWAASQAMRNGRVKAFTTPVRITATVHIADHRRREVSNLFPTFKAAIDGMVEAGLLVDDSDAYVTGPDPRRAYDTPPRITFRLEELPELPC